MSFFGWMDVPVLDGRQADGVLLVDNSPGMVHMRRLVIGDGLEGHTWDRA